MGISLINLEILAKCWIFFFKGAFAHFLLIYFFKQVCIIVDVLLLNKMIQP